MKKGSLSSPSYDSREYGGSPEHERYSIHEDPEFEQIRYDSTGMFHWCPTRHLDEVVLVSVTTDINYTCSDQYLWGKKSRGGHDS